MTEQEKLLDKLQKIKAHQESAAAIGSEAEAQAFAEMLQRLLMKHKLSMTDLEFERYEKEEPVETRVVDTSKFPEGAEFDSKVPNTTRVEWIETLASIVAKSHSCRILVHNKSDKITLVGRDSDIAVAEYMVVVLTRTVRKITWAACKQYKAEGHRGRDFVDFKNSFQIAFVRRIAERYEAELKTQEGSSSTALVRIKKSEKAVVDFLKQNSRPASMVRSRDRGHSEGYKRGRDAAEGINLKSNGVSGSRSKGNLNG
jgi:hypothetical protein